MQSHESRMLICIDVIFRRLDIVQRKIAAPSYLSRSTEVAEVVGKAG